MTSRARSPIVASVAAAFIATALTPLAAAPADAAAPAARPTDDIYHAAEETPVCRGDICVHYAQDGTNDVPAEDDGAGGTWKGYADNGVPDYVDLVSASLLPKVAKVFADAGWRAPLGDGDVGGGTDQIDIYLADLAGVDGGAYCSKEGPTPSGTVSGFCVLDNDYSPAEYGTKLSRAAHLGLDVAHQYAYLAEWAYGVRGYWLQDATASWVEDEIYPTYDRNRAYLPYSPLGQPGIGLGSNISWPSGVPHQADGAWLFLRFLSDRYPARSGPLPVVVRHLWEHIGESQNYWEEPYLIVLTHDLNLGLAQHGTTLDREFAEFTTWNRDPVRYYGEPAYKPAPLTTNALLTSTAPIWRDSGLRDAPMSSQTHRFRRGNLPGRWNLRVRAFLESRWSYFAATATIKLKGQAAKSRVFVSTDGSGSEVIDLPFTASVEWIDITLVALAAHSHSANGLELPDWYYTLTTKAIKG